MPVAQSPAHYINSSKGYPSITESFPLVVFLVLCATVAALPVVQPHYDVLPESSVSVKLLWALSAPGSLGASAPGSVVAPLPESMAQGLKQKRHLN
jgi:hypothetical protein